MTKAIKVLSVEDNELDRMMITEAIAGANVKIDLSEATDGSEAIRLLADIQNDYGRSPNLVLLDINLPKRNGWEVLDYLKSNDKIKHIPVVIFTTSSSRNDILKAYQKYASLYLVKPFEPDEYSEIIQNLIRFMAAEVILP